MSMKSPSVCLVLFALLITSEPRLDAKRQGASRVLPPEGWTVPPAKDATQPSSFATVEGKRCDVVTTAGEDVAEDIVRFSDLYLRRFKVVFKGRFKIKEKLRMRVFCHREEFLAFFGKTYGGQGSEPRPALYAPHLKETWVLLQGEGPKKTLPIETTKHEFTHHMMHFFTGQANLPPWFTEGAACFFQYWDITESTDENVDLNLKRAESGDFGYFPRVIRQYYGRPEFLTPEQLFQLPYRLFHTKHPDHERLYYSESWAITNFLVTTPGGKKFYSKIAKILRDGKDLRQELSPKTLEALRRAWYQDIESRILTSGEG